MSSENDLVKLYSERILALATELHAPARLDAPDGSVKKRSPLCGSAVTVDVKMEEGKFLILPKRSKPARSDRLLPVL